MRNNTTCLLAGGLLAVALIVPAVALAYQPPRPASGKWKLGPGAGMKVVQGKSITGIHFDLTSSEAAAGGCSAGKMSVLGTQKLRVASRGGVSNWVLGHSTDAAEPLSGIAPVKVSVRQGGKTMAGTVALIFAVGGFKRDNDGYVTVGSSCAFSFYASK
jgi:hypothetical protein